jgi:hypothetical protein
MEESESSRHTFDPLTFATRSYVDSSNGKPVLTVTIEGDTATLQRGTSITEVSALPGAPFIIFDYFIAPLFHLPATLRAAGKSTFSLLVVGAENAEPLVVSRSDANRPVGVATSDASVAVTTENKTGTLWYDPQTLVLDEFVFPGARIVYKRVST